MDSFSNETYEFNIPTSTWQLIVPIDGIKPYWRDFHSASVYNHKMYIFGGRMDINAPNYSNKSLYRNDIYEFDASAKKWTEIKSNTDPLDEEIVNLVENINMNDYEDSRLNEYIRLKVALGDTPCGRRSHSAVVYKNRLIIFGGFREPEKEHYNDLFEYNFGMSFDISFQV
jgi:hypothetical protein